MCIPTQLSAGSTVVQYTLVRYVCDLRQPILYTMVQLTAASRNYLYYTAVQYSILSRLVAMLSPYTTNSHSCIVTLVDSCAVLQYTTVTLADSCPVLQYATGALVDSCAILWYATIASAGSHVVPFPVYYSSNG